MQYTLIQEARRSVRIKLLADGSLQVRAPKWMTRSEIDAVLESKAQWIEEKRAITQRASREWGGKALTPAELEGLKKAAREDFPARVTQFAPLVGSKPEKLTIRTQHARWGSCSGKGNISLNALLMLAPEHVRDYVVVHELCHLLEMNHSPKYWAEVARVLPDYAAARDWLKENGAAILSRNPTTSK